jgi:hypothetical protein
MNSRARKAPSSSMKITPPLVRMMRTLHLPTTRKNPRTEAGVHWRDFINSIGARGVGISDLITLSAHSGMAACLSAAL